MNNKTNLLLLDIDGVLNNTESLKQKLVCDFHSAIFEGRPLTADGFNFNEHSIQALKYILNNVDNLKLVISSNWRYHTKKEHFIELFKLFDINFTNIELMESTVEDPIYYKRSFIILKHVASYWKAGTLGKYVAVDDRKDLYHSEFANIVFTNPDDGLTIENALSIVDMFNN